MGAVSLIFGGATADLSTYLENDSHAEEYSTVYSTGRDTWQGIAQAVFCGTSGSDTDKATAVRESLHDYDGGSNWIVFVSPPEYGAAWTWAAGWEVLDKRNL